MKRKSSASLLSPILGIAIFLLSAYFLLPNLLELSWVKVPGKISNLEKTSIAENSHYQGTVESTWFEVEYEYTYQGSRYAGKDFMGGRSKYPVGKASGIAAEIELIVNPDSPSQSMVKRPLLQLPIFGVFASLFLILGPVIGKLFVMLSQRRLKKSISKSIEKNKSNSPDSIK